MKSGDGVVHQQPHKIVVVDLGIAIPVLALVAIAIVAILRNR